MTINALLRRRCLTPYRSRRRHGQQLLEASFALLVLITLTLGLIQYGIIYNAAGSLGYLAREGARYAAIHANDTNTTLDGVTMLTDVAIKTYVRKKALKSSIKSTDLPDANIAISPAPGDSLRDSGQPITVALTYDLRKKIFLGVAFPGISRLRGNYIARMSHMIE